MTKHLATITYGDWTYSCMHYGPPVGIATRYGLDGPGIEFQWGGEIFLTRPDWPWSLPNLLYNGYGVNFPGLSGRGVVLTTHPRSSAEVKERVEMYLYSPSGPSWPVLWRTLLYFTLLYFTLCTHTSVLFVICEQIESSQNVVCIVCYIK